MKPILSLTLAAALLAVAGHASAGVCPAGEIVAGGANGDGHAENIGVTDEVLAVNDLGAFYPELGGRDQRIRYLTVAPGGEVAWHDHGDRPALIYVLSGEILEHRSDCRVPVVHKAGEVSAEIGPVHHWWKNESTETVELLSADLPRAE